MKKDGKSKVKGKISTKKEAKETIDMFKSISGEWEVDLETNEITANFKGIKKGEGVPKSRLTSADKEWIVFLRLMMAWMLLNKILKPSKNAVLSKKN